MIERTHMTKNRSLQLTRKTSVDQKNSTFKPVGLWYGIGNAWIDWCMDEMPHWIAPYLYTFDLHPDINLLTVDSVEAIRSFTDRYETHPWKEIPHWILIDWGRVCEEYDGIEFNPYLYNMRFDIHHTWYNSIDVPSGVIFNTDMVVNLKRHYTKTYLHNKHSCST
jgi:hypothetical protein